MKVAMVSPFPAAGARIVGGVAGAAKYLVDELSRQPDVQLTILVPQGARGGAVDEEAWPQARVLRLPRTGLWKPLPGTLYDLAAGKRQLHQALSRLAPDVVHFQGCSFLAAGCSLPSVLTVHGIGEKDAVWDRRALPGRWAKRLVMRATEAHGRRRTLNVIAISEVVEAMLAGSPARRVWRIPNPVAEAFFNVRRSPEPGRVFTCSRVTPLKNLAGLIGAFARAAAVVPQARLRIAGEGDPAYRAACQRLAERRGVAGRVEWLGSLSVEEVRSELARARCFALASFQENAPLSLAEAMAAGVPAAVSAVGGVPEMLDRGRAGLLLDPGSEVSVADALSALLSDDALAARLSRRARELAEKRHRASVVARRTLEVYAEMLGRCAA